MKYADIHDSLVRLKFANQDQLADRFRIRAILDGGVSGIYAVLAWNVGKQASMAQDLSEVADEFGVDLPTVNFMDSGLNRLAQKVGRPPTLKPPKADGETVIARHQKRIDLLKTWDEEGRISRMAPQKGRWLPGYGFVFDKLVQRTDRMGQIFPVMESRDPYDTFVGWLGPDQQPKEYATVRRIPINELVWRIDDPAVAAEVTRKLERGNRSQQFSFLSHGERTWEGIKAGVEIIEYECHDFRAIAIPEAEHVLKVVPNVLSIPTFTFARRYTFNKPHGQYHHVIGLQGMQAKLNILYMMAIEDGVMVETNIDGDVDGRYEFGRGAVNMLTPGTKVARPYPPAQTQTLQAINTLERQLRIGANYDVQQDGTSPNSFATGMGMRELQGAVNDNVREYHMVLSAQAEDNDWIRQAWAAELYKGQTRQYYDMKGKAQSATIDNVLTGDYRTRRIYGAMATFDDHQKIIVGMQLETGGYIDPLTLQENIDGLEDLELINERITRKKYREILLGRLMAKAETDPTVEQVLVKIMANPDKELELLAEAFPEPPTPEEMAGQQAQMMAAQQGGPVGVPAGPPDPIQTVLSRVEGSGAVDGGVQSVAVR